MNRTTLRAVIQRACAAAETDDTATGRLVATADSIDRVLVGAYSARLSGVACGCPATLAGYVTDSNDIDDGWAEDATDQVKDFPGAFDNIMDCDHASEQEHDDGVSFIAVTD